MVCTPFLSKGLLLVATFHIIASYKFKFGLGTINRISAKSGDAFDIQDYFPTSGIETFITTVASRRMLLPTEYELLFEAYPVLKERYLSQKWPERDLHNDEDVAKSLLWVGSTRDANDVDRALINFRKTVLGLEKYRINNPGRVAEQYCVLLKSCLEVEDCWGSAANALEYAGLMIKDHVVDRTSEGEGVEGVTTTSPVLVVSSLWRQACMRLLDIDVECTRDIGPQSAQQSRPDAVPTSAATSTSKSPPSLSGVGETWDQRFFSQVELTDSARVAIKDMMLNILRVAVRCLLSREGVQSCDIALEEFDSPGPSYFPAASSVKIILSLDKALRMVEEGECSDADMHLVQSVTDRAKAVIAVASSSDDKTVPALSSVDESRISSSSERGSDVSVANPEGDSNASGSMKTLLSNQSALSTGAISSSEEEIEEKQEEDKEGSWDIDEMYVGSTDAYVLYTVCDIRSTIESKPRKGLFDAFLSNKIEQQGEE